MSEAAERAQSERWRMADAHGPENLSWDNLGEGWRISCLCGFQTCPCKTVADVGEDFDDHLETMKG